MRPVLTSAVVAFLAFQSVPVCRTLAASPNAARELGNQFADAVERVMPSVVVIRTEATVYRAARDMFFGQVYGIPEHLAGQGSGVIISKDGYVLTSNHVIENAEKIEVVLSSGTKYDAHLVGRDAMTDLAVLKIQTPGAAEFTPVEPGDSDKLRVGEFVIAIGSPFSLNSSVTAGIVSQKGRSVGILPFEDFIQTDAPINPGNSGGPLVDVDGRLVGINSIIQTGGPYSSGNIGIGFAVPANMAMHVAQSLIKDGKVERPWLGIHLQSVDKPDAGSPGAADAGVRVGEVFGNTPAARCGLEQGDVIVKTDGQPVSQARDVQRCVFRHQVGESVKLDVLRNGNPMIFEIVTDRMPEFDQVEP